MPPRYAKHHQLDINFVKGLFFPNAFSPEDPSVGVRTFQPTGFGLKSFNVAVYDQWGNKIWESSRLDDSSPVDFWDGTVNGEPAPQDVYVWKAEAVFVDGTIWQGVHVEGEKARRYGIITLIR